MVCVCVCKVISDSVYRLANVPIESTTLTQRERESVTTLVNQGQVNLGQVK